MAKSHQRQEVLSRERIRVVSSRKWSPSRGPPSAQDPNSPAAALLRRKNYSAKGSRSTKKDVKLISELTDNTHFTLGILSTPMVSSKNDDEKSVRSMGNFSEIEENVHFDNEQNGSVGESAVSHILDLPPFDDENL